MEIEEDCIISIGSYQGLPPSDDRQWEKDEVQSWLNDGSMTQDAIYQRYTEKLARTVITSNRSNAVLENIKLAFRQLRDPDGTYLSQDLFEHAMAQKFDGTISTDHITILYEIFRWHAFFPFPSNNTGSGTSCINEDAFIRAILLLTRNPPAYLSPDFCNVSHNTSSGYWGPHHGQFVSNRGKDAVDYSRWIFRSLAIPNDEHTDHDTIIQVPRFIDYQPRLEGESRDSDSEEDLGQQFVVVENEKEREVDVHDIVSESAPGWDERMVANPLREAYAPVLSWLPAQRYDLVNLHVPVVKLLNLLKALQMIGRAENPEKQEVLQSMIDSVEMLYSGGNINWESFKNVIADHGELIADCLSNIFETFKRAANTRI